MSKISNGVPNCSSRLRSFAKKAAASHWFERTLFALGSIVLFSSEQILTNGLDEAREDVAYVERNMSQYQDIEAERQRWLAEYNRSVAMRPQARDLVAQSAFQLFAALDQIISQLHAVVEQNGRGEVFSIIEEKNKRREAAANELMRRDAEALVARLNNIFPEYEANVRPLVGRLIIKRQNALSDESMWKGRVKWSRLLGTFLLAGAFLLREAKDYRKQRLVASAELEG